MKQFIGGLLFSILVLTACGAVANESGQKVEAESNKPYKETYLEDYLVSGEYLVDKRSGCLYFIQDSPNGVVSQLKTPVYDNFGKVVGCRSDNSATRVESYFGEVGW